MTKFPPISPQVSQSRYSFLKTALASTSLLEIVCIGRECCNPDYRLARENFAGYGIEFVASGRGEVTLDGKTWPLRPGTLFCYGPRTSHIITTDQYDPMTKFFVDLAGKNVAALLRNSPLQPGSVIYTLELDQIQILYETMMIEGGRGLPVSTEICLKYLQILLLKAHETIAPQNARLSQAAINFQRCKSCIDTHFTEMRDLEDIAQRVHVTPAYLCRLFQKFGQLSPFQYLTRKKLNQAAELLVGERRAVKDAAIAVGYPDPYHFSRAFSRFFGVSPSDFVKNHRR